MLPAPTNMLTRRSIILVVVTGFFLGALLIASGRLGDSCPDGSNCFRHKVPDFHADDKAPSKATKPAEIKPPVLQVDHNEKPDKAPQASSKPSQPSESSPAAIDKPSHKINPGCANFPDTSKVLVVMKTGASEAYGKVPTQIMTNLRCLPEYLIFSDKAQVIAGHPILDSLDTVSGDVAEGNDDFTLYFRQQECPIDVDNCNKHADAAKEGWALDKYKNVHIAEKTFKLKPNYEWYLFTDADTYVVWPTLMEWLKRLDGSKPQYLGSVAMLGDFPFGHGGSGYLVSRPSMKAMFAGKERVANLYDQSASETCCGDYMFAYALKNETGVEVQNMVRGSLPDPR